MIYICIPTHNEQQTVGVVLWKLRQVLTDFPREYQLLVADDASTDKTPQVLEPYTRVLPLTVIRSDRRQGPAASLEMLLREAVRRSEYPKRDVIVTLQADFSEEPDDMVPLVKRIEAGADVAAGNKISGTKEPRGRRFARSLASFFMRRQKWPEGIASPFDGYRAYRLYSVKRAMEDRKGRLIQHDGWAGHAELLRAVLPHARRVDVVNVDDRPDRHQRPRRERPFAAAMQVRVLGSGAEPPGLVGVEELDRIAATASRSRDRGAPTAQSLGGGTESRANGSAQRQGGARDTARRSRANGGRQRSEAGDGRRQDGRAARPKREAAAGSERSGPKGEETRRGRKPRSEAPRTRRKPREEGAADQPGGSQPGDDTEPIVKAETGDGSEAARPKKRRRRRKRGGQQSGGQSAPGEPGAAATEESAEGPTAESAASSGGPADGAEQGPESSDSAPTGEKKRRRRGGRRGGRGRRRPKRDGVDGEENTDTGDSGAGAADAGAGAAEPVARTEND